MKLASLCYVKKNGKTLMLHRVKRKNDIHQGKWNGLGGKFQPGETPEECVIREVKEESGLSVKKPTLKGFLTFPDFSQGQDWYVFVFTARHFEGELIECNEGELEWIDDEKIATLPLWEGDLIFLEWLNQDRLFSGKFLYRDGHLVEHDVAFY